MGKSFLINKLFSYFLAKSILIISTATSGIAATLLEKGKTVHSTFKVPCNLYEYSILQISK